MTLSGLFKPCVAAGGALAHWAGEVAAVGWAGGCAE